MEATFSGNIPRLYVIKIAKWFNMVMPVVVLFYQNNGLNMQQIFELKAIYSVAIVAMEVPSGWMADIWGRKKTLLAGAIFGSAGFLIYSLSFGFWAFAIAEVVLGFGHSCVSGADSAMLYDSLKADGKTGQYTKAEGRVTSVGNFSEALAGVAGGLAASLSLRLPFYFQFAIAFMAVPAALTLAEPKIHSGTHLVSIRKFIGSLGRMFMNNLDLRISLLLSAVTGTATLTFAWLVQPYFLAIGLPVEWFGIFWTALNLAVGFSSALAHRFEGKLENRFTLPAIILLVGGGYFLSGITVSWWGLSFLFLFYIIRGLATPILKSNINHYTESHVRATILSVRDFLIRLFFAAIGPLLGWTTDNISLNKAFLLAGVFYLGASVLIIFPWLRKEFIRNKL
jgi:MFS family permease